MLNIYMRVPLDRAVDAASQRNAKVRAEIESIKDLVKVLGPQGAVLWQAIRKGRVSVVPVPQGGNLNITPPGR
ncbi:hypothetical protein ABZ260_18000 [Streptosporangium sp. NPDC006013]|uniref:hypothetical protein n=1 Tax=Streptosporangium sp. NPDC006013 TaxID=3155596 RepID=UPI0033AF8040